MAPPHHPLPFSHAQTQLQFRTLAHLFGPAAAAMFATGSGSHLTAGLLPGAPTTTSGLVNGHSLGSYMAAAAAAEWRLAAKAIQHNYHKLLAQSAVAVSSIPETPTKVGAAQSDQSNHSPESSSTTNGALTIPAGWNLKNAATAFAALNSKMNSTHISAPNLHLNHSNSSSASCAISPQHQMLNIGK